MPPKVGMATLMLWFVIGICVIKDVNSTNWNKIAKDTLNEALKIKPNNRIAKNVIIFIGDGMGLSTINAARIYKGQKLGNTGEETTLEYETFPNVALAKVYGTDKQVPESAQTATALLCGEKTNFNLLGLKDSVGTSDCSAYISQGEEAEIDSIIRQAIEQGKSAGVVTTARLTHATPAATYAHSPDRNWESDADIGPANGACKDIAQQLIDNNHDIQVLLGGGRRAFLPVSEPDPETNAPGVNKRMDGRNLVDDWESIQQGKNNNYRYVWKKQDFDDVDPDEVDFLLGGRIDHAHHENKAKKSLEEAVQFEEAIKMAMSLIDQKDTLVVVTADHSHPFSLTGYTNRGNPILGLVDPLGINIEPTLDGLPYTSLLYGNGPGYTSPRQDLTGVDTETTDFIQQSAVPLEFDTHSGEDVGIYALGPMSHLFHGVHEQHYVAHVIQYAACIGEYAKNCRKKSGTLRSVIHGNPEV
ncbi:alkaline phosphatase, tissue-nonspecific isozyme isoform X2 [Magallana gigas]|uniref:alkaline phosphatase, tissue-nonspecific isozyme isoform X2 n=1 Tax=Magallana gigas TaxID=29159 RepID=UPI0033421B32